MILSAVHICNPGDEGEKLSANFTAGEFKSKDGSQQWLVCPLLVSQLQTIRDRLGVPLKINSGYRSPEHNKKVGGASNSMHIYGNAADVACPSGITPERFAGLAFHVGFTGIGVYNGRVHMDTRTTGRAYWRKDGGTRASGDLATWAKEWE